MNDLYDNEIKSIKDKTSLSVKSDPAQFFYGFIILCYGVSYMENGISFVGYLHILSGGLHLMLGFLSFTWKSHNVKILQAFSKFSYAFLLLVLLAMGILKSMIILGFALLFILFGYWNLKQYKSMSKIAASNK
ncbi:MAG: hypothetical protein H8E57_04680, partial [Candidatus Cloacimonetes bacterium]|nr:hypothetical protein [Candidatus Cloacimonadota bacterium]